MIKLKCTLLPNLSHERFVFSGRELRIVYQDGKFTNEEDFATIRERLLG
jgi:hypothetical protein